MLDLIVLLIFGVAVIRGLKKGFVNGIIGLVGTIAAIVLAVVLSAPVAEAAFDWFVKSPTENAIAANVGETASSSMEDSLEAAQAALPGYVQSMMDSGDVTLSDVTASMDQTMENTPKSIASAVTTQVVKPMVVLLIRGIVCVVLAIALLIAVSFLGKLIRKLIRITPFKKIDGVLGGVLGAVRGLLFVLLAVTVMQIIAGFSAPDAMISQKSLQESVIAGRIADVNPIYSGDIVKILR